MTLAEELLDTARHLVNRNRSRPTQADLRRAVSTAYYALFQLLTGDAVERVVADDATRAELARGFEHRDMKKACQGLLAPTLPFPLSLLLGTPVDSALLSVAAAFVKLQDARHLADYDSARVYRREEALTIVGSAGSSFAAWSTVRATPAAQTFLALLFLGLKPVKTR